MRRCPTCNSFFDDTVTACPYDGESLVEVQLGSKPKELEGSIFAGRYKIERRIGEGGMGMVYEAIDTQTDQRIAIKVLHRDVSNDERTVKRFYSEARILNSLSHQNIITLYDFGRGDDNRLYIAMELLSGRPADVLIKYKALSYHDALTIIEQTAAGLHEAHLQGIIHRDLKPANIFVNKNPDGTLRVTVLDFGIAKISGGQNLTVTGKVMGTPSYMAPEQIMGKQPDPRTDIYALGAMGYELLTGRPPFVSDAPLTLLYSHLNDTPPRINELVEGKPFSRELEETLLRFLAKSPDDRPRNNVEVCDLLAPFIQNPALIERGAEDNNATHRIDHDEVKRRLQAADEAAKLRAVEHNQMPTQVLSQPPPLNLAQPPVVQPHSPVVQPQPPSVQPQPPPAQPPKSRTALILVAVFIGLLLASGVAVGLFFALKAFAGKS